MAASTDPGNSVGFNRQIGLCIRALREDRGWTVRELAELSGVHWDTIYELEGNPHPNPRLDTLLQIARVFMSEALEPPAAKGA